MSDQLSISLLCTRMARQGGDVAEGGVGARASDGRAWAVIGDFRELADKPTGKSVPWEPGASGHGHVAGGAVTTVLNALLWNAETVAETSWKLIGLFGSRTASTKSVRVLLGPAGEPWNFWTME